MFEGVEFLNRYFFWLFSTFPVLIAWYIYKHKKQAVELKVSSVKGFKLEKSMLSYFKLAFTVYFAF